MQDNVFDSAFRSKKQKNVTILIQMVFRVKERKIMAVPWFKVQGSKVSKYTCYDLEDGTFFFSA